MTSLLDILRKKLAAQTNCPCCGANIRFGGPGNSRNFECGSEFIIRDSQIRVSAECPASSRVAVAQLNKEAFEEAAEAGA